MHPYGNTSSNPGRPAGTSMLLERAIRPVLPPHPLLDVPVYGRISALEFFRPPGEAQDLLYLLTERYHFCVLTYDAVAGELVTRANGNLEDRVGRATDNGQIGVIDPEHRLIGLHLYDGLLKVIPIDAKGQLKDAFNVRLEELQVIDIIFLHGLSKPTIAVLYEDTRDARHVKTYEVSLKDKELTEGPWMQQNVDMGAGLLIPVPKPLGGCIIVGEQTIVYHSGSSFKAVGIKHSIIRAFEAVDPDGSRYLLSDQAGLLHLLALQHDGKRVLGLRMEALGETSVASSISYLDNSVVFIGSMYGDSQLIKLNTAPDSTGQFVEVLDSFVNLGPIVDLSVVDLERQGQGQVVTCSGAFKDGSLRVVRNGIGIDEQAAVELPGIKGMWSLASTMDETDAFLVVTFMNATRILAINADDELEETEIEGFEANTHTLYCGNAVHDQLVQVTRSALHLVACGTRQQVDVWKPPAGVSISVASGNKSQLLLATGGGTLVYLEIGEAKVQEVKHVQLEFEISCLNISSFVSPTTGQSGVAAVGLWTDHSCKILSLPSLEVMTHEKLGDDVNIPRSVLLCALEGVHYFLCALGDGHLYTFVIDPSSGTLSDRKKMSLGTQPISLSAFESKNATHVFAASDRPTVIYSSNKKMLYSNVNISGEVYHVCPFNSASFPDSLAIAVGKFMTIGTIDEIQKLHIRTIPLGEAPRRLCHQESSKTFLVTTMKLISPGTLSDECEQAWVKLLDNQTFEIEYEFQLEPFETTCSCISTTFADDPQAYYVVGTAFAHPDEMEPTKGRILVFLVKDRKLHLVCEKDIKGAAYNLNGFHGKLLAGVNSQLHLYKWATRDDGTKELQASCSHHGHIMVLFVCVRGDFIVVGDLMKSISLLIYKAEEEQIVERARDYNSNWMSAIEVIDDDTFIGAENSFNIFTVRKNSDAATDDERARLDVVGEYHVGEFINKFRHGSLVMRMPESEAAKIPTLIFGTVNGMIGLVACLPAEQFQYLQTLQRAVAAVVKGVGGLSHEKWRSFCTERKTSDARGFLDGKGSAHALATAPVIPGIGCSVSTVRVGYAGDLIESFLDLKRDKMEEVALKMQQPVEELCKVVEELARLH
eukprot:scaffold1343_cov369-Prasinococcus_capsulatus_cf.AAC.10